MDIGIGLGGFGHSGSAPAPFDALNGPALAGPSGSHPLHHVAARDLVRTSTDHLSGAIDLDGPIRVGEAIRGRLRLAALRDVEARSATLRLVGLRLVERTRSREDRDSEGRVTHRESWVEADGELFVDDAFADWRIPARLAAGETFETAFAIPAPRLGPPTAHLGEAIVAWAVVAKFDIAWGGDQHVAAFAQVDQHPDLLRAGVGKQGGVSLLGSVAREDWHIDVAGSLPVRIAVPFEVTAVWPGAPSGRGARIELHRRTNAPNGTEGIIDSVPVDPASLHGGASATLVVPPDSAPSFDGAGLEIGYVIRVLVDRQFRSDAAIERPLGVA